MVGYFAGQDIDLPVNAVKPCQPRLQGKSTVE